MRAIALLLPSLLALPIAAAPSIGVVTVTPMTAVVGSPTHVTIEASITDPSLIPGSINLLQLNPNGATTILGTLHDDGLGDDPVAGDLLFTLAVTLNAPSTSQIQLQISAAFKGILGRVRSTTMNIFFQSADAPQKAIAALAQNLAAGNIAGALNYVIPSSRNTTALNTLNQDSLNALAAILTAGVLIESEPDLRVFRAPTISTGPARTVEFSLIPGPNGQWLINNW